MFGILSLRLYTRDILLLRISRMGTDSCILDWGAVDKIRILVILPSGKGSFGNRACAKVSVKKR
jgi:hypothetical protein